MKKLLVALLVLIASKFVLAQTGTFDPSFGEQGVVINKFDIIAHEPTASTIAPDKKWVLGIKGFFFAETAYLMRVLPNGSIDTSFGNEGVVTHEVESYEFIAAVVVDSGLRVTALVSNNDLFNLTSYLIRYKVDGTIDSSFGNNGIVSLDSEGHAMLLQEDGKIVIAGNYDFEKGVLIRINTDGTFDPTFKQGSSKMYSITYATFYDLKRDADGRYVATGYVPYFGFIVACFKEGIGLDTGFSGNGEIVITGGVIGSTDQRCAVQPDGKIIATYKMSVTDGFACEAWRFNSNGTVDSTFDADGNLEVQSPVHYYTNFGDLLCFSDATVLFGMTYFDGYSYQPVLKKFKQDGTPDNTFGQSGEVMAPYSATDAYNPFTFHFLNEDTIGFSGTSSIGINTISTIAKFSSEGIFDTTFGEAGFLHLPLPASPSLQGIDQLQPLNDGKILANGDFYPAPSSQQIPMIRFLSNGTVDSTYGVNGVMELPGYSTFGTRVMTKSDNYVYLARAEALSLLYSFPVDPDSIYLSVFRFKADGVPDSTFGVNGRVNPQLPGHVFKVVEEMLIDADGKILLTGELYTATYNITNGFVLRLNADGTVDSTFGEEGIRVFDLYDQDYFYTIAAQSDHKILMAAIDSLYELVIYRLKVDGTMDSLFGSYGVVSLSLDSQIKKIRMITLQDDRIFLMLEPSMGLNFGFTFLMLLPDGSPDPSFSDDGMTVFKFCDKERITAIRQVTDGNIVFSGTGWHSAGSGSGQDYDVLAGKIKTNGLLDENFGNDGIIQYTYSLQDNANDLQIQEDGKILVGGRAEDKYLMIRFLNDSSIATGALNEQANILLSVYPNPAKDEVVLKTNPTDPIQQVILTDMNGHVLKVYDYDDSSISSMFSVNELGKGVYLISVITQTRTLRQKLVKI